ncbi:hypothetical protein BFP77_00045 [Maribacter sp. 4U21]|uniref:hypothetical protein n=1 Tax=Maribacter sp. 4U21 TaxID=1889779 RepID=UPI000C14EBAD|nr:hypothetical protein [Maribacter sp. 4U21]PIB28367.1 hypothetical protein BFP77_00045 [Maribacter sp. 4U21]
MLEIKGGRGRHWRVKQPPGFFREDDGGGGGCAGQSNSFGGTNDADEVVVEAVGPRYYPSSTGGSATGSVFGQIVKAISRVPSQMLTTQGLNTSTPFSFKPGYWAPTSNCN